jgi:hypothetical protein
MFMARSKVAKRARNAGGLIFGQNVELDSGLVVRRSLRKMLFKLTALAVLVCVFTAIVGISAFGAYQVWLKKPEYSLLILLALAAFALLSVLLAGYSLFAIAVSIYAIFRNERLIVGATYLQCIIGEAKANVQLPFTNIAAIHLAVKTENDVSYPFIGINLKDVEARGTLLSPAGIDHHQQNFGHDAVLLDEYEIPLDELHETLTAQWKKSRRRKRDS